MAKSGKASMTLAAMLSRKFSFAFNGFAYPIMVSELHRLIFDPAPCTRGPTMSSNVIICSHSVHLPSEFIGLYHGFTR